MKKIYLIFSVAMLGLAAGCSSDSAFTEEEKEKQDSADASSQEDKFKNMEQEMGNDSSKKPNPSGLGPNEPMMKNPPNQTLEKKDAVPLSGDLPENSPNPNEKK